MDAEKVWTTERDGDEYFWEQSGTEVLILYPITPRKIYDFEKKREVTVTHGLENRWLSNPEDVTSVRGSDSILLTKGEANKAKRRGLFKSFDLF